MYELIQVSEQSYYIQSPAKIGLVKLNEQDVCLIDSGNDKDAGHKFLMAQESDAQELTRESLPKGFEIIPLPGAALL